jgi:pilus assembly protein Flp/PilA
MLELLRRLRTEDDGQDLAEYALLLTLITAAVALVVTGLGTDIKAVFNNVISIL